MMNKIIVALGLAAVTAQLIAIPADDAKWEAWQNRRKSYIPDYSDSSKYLLPPETGRIATPIQIARNGQALAEIVFDDSKAIFIDNFYPKSDWDPLEPINQELKDNRGHERAVARYAAAELKTLLKMVTEADFETVRKPTGTKKTRIFLGATFAKDHFAKDIAAIVAKRAKDGFAIRVKDGDIYIFGAQPAGTVNGVFAFVENNTDLIWAYPRVLTDDDKPFEGTVFTVNRDLSIVWADALELPEFVIRGWMGGDLIWMHRNRSNSMSPLINRGMSTVAGGHYFSPQYYDHASGMRKFNPENQSGVKSESWDEYGAITCYTQPDYLEHAAETIPCVKETRMGTTRYCIFGMDDTPGHCWCKLCTAPIKAIDGTMLTPKKHKNLFWSARYYEYLNKLDDEIQKVCPGYITSTFAYFYTNGRPPIKLNKHIVPMFCCYGRSDRSNPVFSPSNRVWIDFYRGWMEHTKELNMYDYYGFLSGRPYAEVMQEELRAMREIGFLRQSTEGFMRNDFIGAADERWCCTRLYWNPDYDTEQLHRYFNRRTYREAAPWIDKYRGELRKAVFKADQEKAGGELLQIITDAGIEEELRDYLAKAADAAQHPVSQEIVKRSIEAFDLLTGKIKPPEVSNVDEFGRKIKKKKKPAYRAPADVEVARRAEVLSKEIIGPITHRSGMSAQEAFDLYIENAEIDDQRVYGCQPYWSGAGHAVIRTIADAYASISDWDNALEIFDILIKTDREIMPPTLLEKRLAAKVVFCRTNSHGLKLAGIDWQKDYKAWEDMLKICVTEGSRARDRGYARLQLVKNNKDFMESEAGIKEIETVLFDVFMPNSMRASAAMMLEKAVLKKGEPKLKSIKAGKKSIKIPNTDWKRVLDVVGRAIKQDDWSNLTRNCYSRQSRRDQRLEVACDLAYGAFKSGLTDEAAKFFDEMAEVLGYKKDMKKTLAAENRTIPRSFDRATMADIGDRFKRYQQLQNRIVGFAPKVDDGEEELSLDEE